MSESNMRCAATGGHGEFDAQLAFARLAGRLEQLANVVAKPATSPSNIRRALIPANTVDCVRKLAGLTLRANDHAAHNCGDRGINTRVDKHVAFIRKVAATGRTADLGFERSRR